MPAGIQGYINGSLHTDTSTFTSRQLGSRVCTAGHLERLTVPVAPGKTLWWHIQVTGNLSAFCYRATYVDSSLNQGPNEFTIQVDPPNWNQAQTGTAYVTWGEHVVGSSSDGGGGGPDFVPDAISLANINIDTPNETGVGTPRTFQVTGINQPISLRVARTGTTTTGNMSINRTYVRTADNQNGPWTTHATFIANGQVDFTVTNGKWVQITFEKTTSSGVASTAYSVAITNQTLNAAMASFTVNARVDNDNNFGVSDPHPDAVNWANISTSTTALSSSQPNAVQTIKGINQTINVRATISNFTGTNVATTSTIDTYVAGVRHGGSSGLGNGHWSAANVSNNQNVHFVAVLNPANAALQASCSYTVTVQNITTGATLDTFTVNQTSNVADYTLDAFSMPALSLVTNEADGWTNTGAFTVSGVNRPVVLRFTRGNQVDSGGIFTRRLFIYHSTNGGSSWTEYFIGAGAQGVADITVNNGDIIHIRAYCDTQKGRGDTSFTCYIANQSTGGNQISTFNVTATVDADNNFNVPDYTPDAVSFNPISFTTNDATGWYGATSQIKGINQPITLRVERYSYTGNLTTAYVHVYRGPTANGPWTGIGAFNCLASGLQYLDFTVTNGEFIHYAADAQTTSGRRTGNWDVAVWNLSVAPSQQISRKSVAMVVDNDNNHNIQNNTPNPVDWANLSVTTNDPTGLTSGSFKQITGINVPITLRVQISGATGNLSTWRQNVHYNPSGSASSGGPWTNTSVTGNGGYVDFTITNNQWIYFDSYATTDSGKRAGSWTTTVTNLTTGQVLDTFTTNITVDNDNNHNVGGPAVVTVSPTWLDQWEFANQGQFYSVYVGRVDISIAGGTAPFTYTWERSGGLSGWSVSSYTTYADFYYTGQTNFQTSANYRLKITDAQNRVSYSDYVSVSAGAGNIMN